MTGQINNEKRHTLFTRVPPATHRRIKATAAERGWTLQDVMAILVVAWALDPEGMESLAGETIQSRGKGKDWVLVPGPR